MVEGGCSLGFPAEALQSLWIPGNVLWQEFQGNMSMELFIFSPLDDTHVPAADFFNDPEVRNRLTNLRHVLPRL